MGPHLFKVRIIKPLGVDFKTLTYLGCGVYTEGTLAQNHLTIKYL